jgi:hypothetical protein
MPCFESCSTKAQSQLKFNPDGSARTWECSPNVARIQLCRLIAHLNLPLYFNESGAFEEYITTAHNPRFVVSLGKQPLESLLSTLNDCRAQLVECLKSVFFVALTSDIWSDNAKEDYLSVVVHYVNAGWQLEKMMLRILLSVLLLLLLILD